MSAGMWLILSMFQQDLFATLEPARPVRGMASAPPRLDLPSVLERIAAVSSRPRFTFMVFNLIAKAASASGRAGPDILAGDRRVPIRDWLCEALSPMRGRDPRRLTLADRVRADLRRRGELSPDQARADIEVETELQVRVLRSGRTQISRAVSDLVQAGLIHRHYQGWRTDHPNRGAQREAVYTLTGEARAVMVGTI